MVWIKNTSIGNVRVADLGIEFEFDETRWIEPDDAKSKDLQAKIRKGFLMMVKGITRPKNPTSITTRKKALNLNNKFFPFGRAQELPQTEMTTKIRKSLQKLGVSEADVQYNKVISSKQLEKIDEVLKEQKEIKDLLKTLADQGIAINIPKENKNETLPPEKQFIPIPRIDEMESNIESSTESTNKTIDVSSSEIDDAGKQLRKLRKKKKSTDEEESEE